jgi:hypothetical protein
VELIMSNILEFKPRPYQTAQTTIDAFWYVVRLNDTDYLEAWLADHPKDLATLLKIYEERKNVRA